MFKTIANWLELGAAEHSSVNELMAILDEQPFDHVTPDIWYRESILASFRMDPR